MTDLHLMYPSPIPENEEEVSNNAEFISQCIDDIADHAKKHDWRFGDSILTSHNRWGLVWRVDIHTKNDLPHSKTVQRYICWRPQEMKDGIGGTAFIYAKKEDRLR